MDKEEEVRIYNGILLNDKKNELLPFATAWTDWEGITLSETRQREKGEYCMTSLLCGI